MMNAFFDWRDHVGVHSEKFFKATLWQGQYIMVGINCLEEGQTQKVHAHEGADKFYFVLEGTGEFTIADASDEAKTGSVVIAPAGTPHGVTNTGNQRLSLLVAIAPPPR